jgi:hypothetical protein
MPPVVTAVMMFMATMTFAWIFSAIFLRPKSLQKRGIPLVGKSKGKKMDFGKMLEDAARKVRSSNPHREGCRVNSRAVPQQSISDPRLEY